MRNKTKILFLFSLTCLLVSICLVPSVSAQSATTTSESKAKEAIQPKISIPIPNMPSLSKVMVEGGKFSSSPWIVEYLVGIYNYGIILGSIVATLVFMIGGLFYVLAGAYPAGIQKSKSMMTSALLGLVILLITNIILNTINPNLTNLKTTLIENIPLDFNIDPVYAEKADGEGWISGGSGGKCPAPKNSVLEYCGVPTNSDPHPDKNSLVQLMKDFAACGNFNYNILVGMCEHESGFRPGLVNCACFKGLYQFKYDTWTASMKGWTGGADTAYYLNQIGVSTSPILKNDSRLILDKVQVMGVTGMTMLAIKKINTICKGDLSKLSDSDIATLLYLYHNSGTASLGNTLKLGGCNGGTNIEKGLTESWKQLIVKRCKENAFDKGKSECTAGDGGYQNSKWTGGNYKNLEEAAIGGEMFGAGKAVSVRKAGKQRIIDKYHAEKLFQAVPGAGTCPITIK